MSWNEETYTVNGLTIRDGDFLERLVKRDAVIAPMRKNPLYLTMWQPLQGFEHKHMNKLTVKKSDKFQTACARHLWDGRKLPLFLTRYGRFFWGHEITALNEFAEEMIFEDDNWWSEIRMMQFINRSRGIELDKKELRALGFEKHAGVFGKKELYGVDAKPPEKQGYFDEVISAFHRGMGYRMYASDIDQIVMQRPYIIPKWTIYMETRGERVCGIAIYVNAQEQKTWTEKDKIEWMYHTNAMNYLATGIGVACNTYVYHPEDMSSIVIPHNEYEKMFKSTRPISAKQLVRWHHKIREYPCFKDELDCYADTCFVEKWIS